MKTIYHQGCVFLLVAGTVAFGSGAVLGREAGGESEQTIAALRAEWRRQVSRWYPERVDVMEQRKAEDLEKTVEKLELSTDQANRYRAISWRIDAEFYRNIPKGPGSGATSADTLAHLQMLDDNRVRVFQKLGRETIQILTDRQRVIFRSGCAEWRVKYVESLNRIKRTGPGGTSDYSIGSHKIRVRGGERIIAVVDELIELSRAPSPVVEEDQLAKDTLDQPDDAAFRSANVVATGRISDDKLKWRLETELDRIQQRYDLIASQIEAGRYDHARRNIELLRQALPAAGQLVAQVQAGGDACEVLLIGLPTDAAMARIAELKQMRAENLQHYNRVEGDLSRINDDLFRARTEYINEVWRVMTRNLFEWHSPPAWYEVPQTFKDWHDQSKGQADKILTRQQVIQNLQELEKYLRKEMRNVLDRHRHEIVDKLNPLEEPVSELDSLVQSVVSTLDWTRWTPGERGK